MKRNRHGAENTFAPAGIRRPSGRPLLPPAVATIAVVLVVAMLAMASCLPILGARDGARENARRTSCLNNCKQMMLALKQYSQDFMDTYAWHVGVKKPEEAWRDLGMLFPNYNAGFKSFFCPSADDEHYVLKKKPFDTFEAGDDNSKVISYAYGMDGSGQPTGPWDENAKSTVRILADKKAGIELKDKDARLANHRDDGRNAAYLDGHVKWIANVRALDPDPDDDDVGPPEAESYTKFWSDPPWYREGMDNLIADAAGGE